MKLTTRLTWGICLLLLAATQNYAQTNCESNCQIQCIGQINVSLDQDCYTEITPAMGAVGVEYYCNSYYTVELYNEYNYKLPEPIVGIEHHHKTLTYKVIENDCGNSCWGTIYVEYKYPPSIECPDDLTLSCGAINLLDVPPATGGCSDFDVVLYSQTKELLDCDPDYSSIITRTYRAFDGYGNESFCSHDIYITRLDIDDIIFPGPATISCTDTLMRFDAYGAPIPWYTLPLGSPGMADGVPLICDSGVVDGLYCPTSMDNSGVPLIPNGGAIVIKENPDHYGPQYIVEEVPDQNNTLLCNAVLTYTDVEIPHLPCKRKFIRQWDVREWWCHTELFGGQAQLITVVDDQAPEFHCPSDFTVSTDHECGGHVHIDSVHIYDACSYKEPHVMIQYPNGTLHNNGGYIDLDYGENWLTYIVSDGCYNQSTCDVRVTVEDKRAPVTICETFKVVSLSDDNETYVFAEPFDNGSWDECGLDRFEVRRMDSLCVAQDTLFDKSVRFCCADVGREVMVVFRAYDWAQNYNDCMVRVEVQDKIAPRIQCPPDKTIQCQDSYDINNLDYKFGQPTITDNCSNTQILIETPIDDVNQCGVGTITRLFQIVDVDSVELTHCKQRITIENYQPFIGSNIQWPLDYIAEDVCEIENIDPEDLPEFYDYPRFSGQDECALLGYQYEDKIFQSSNGCAHIKRTWTVINWCGTVDGQYDIWTNPQPQLIEIINTTAPEIEEQEDLNFESLDINCGGDSVRVVRRAMDDCEFLGWYHIVTNSTGDTIRYGLSDTLEIYLPVGTYTVEWIVRDGCGNFDVDYQHLTMVNTKAPTPVCINGLSASLVAMDLDNDGVLETEMVEIWASDFDSGSSYSCGNAITLSLSSDTLVKSLIYDCENIGRNQVQLWVTDQVTGYQDYCVTFIDIQDNNNIDICADSLRMTTVSGTIYTENLEQVEGVTLSLDDNLPTVVSDSDGRYAFGSMPIGGQYDIKPTRDIEYLEGVSTLDLILIQRHILGVEPLDSPYKLLAADIDNNSSISAADLVELRKLILGIYEDLPQQDSWRFVTAEHFFLDDWDPWATEIPESYEIDFLYQQMEVDFIAMKLGDVNGTIENVINGQSIERRKKERLEFVSQDVKQNTMGEIHIPVYADNYSDILGWQTAFMIDREKFDFIGVKSHKLEISDDIHYYYDKASGTLRISYNDMTSKSFTSDELLFEIVLSGDLNYDNESVDDYMVIDPVFSEAYNNRQEILDVVWSSEQFVDSNKILSISPNPWFESARIDFQLMNSGVVQFDVIDISGKLVYSSSSYYESGIQALRIDRSVINTSGLMYVRMYSDRGVDEEKMIILR